MYSVSVIIPLHNSQKYLQECIESILGQTQRDIEIICVDSSMDETEQMIRHYQEYDNRIRLIKDLNTSYGHKINVGIQLAKGEYVAIVESDDYIAENMLEDLYCAAKKTDVDFVMANFEEYIDTQSGRMFSQYNRLEEKDYNRVINLRQETNLMPLIECNIWSGIYQIDFLRGKNIQCNESEGASYQDTGFATLVTLLSEKVYFLKGCYYKYRKDNEGSSVKSEKKYKCIVDEFTWIWKRLKELGCCSEVDITFFKETRLRAFFWNYSRLSGEYREKFLNLDAVKEAAADFDESMLNNYKIPDKELKLKILSGDSQIREKEEAKKSKIKLRYQELLQMFHDYKKIVIVCSGRYGQLVYRLMKVSDCMADICVCDNYTRERMEEFDNREILSVEEAVVQNKEACFIIANKKQGLELKEQIIMQGAKQENIYLYDNNFISDNVSVLYNVIKHCDK